MCLNWTQQQIEICEDMKTEYRKLYVDEAEQFWSLMNQLDYETKYMLYEPGERTKNLPRIESLIRDSVEGQGFLLIIFIMRNFWLVNRKLSWVTMWTLSSRSVTRIFLPWCMMWKRSCSGHTRLWEKGARPFILWRLLHTVPAECFLLTDSASAGGLWRSRRRGEALNWNGKIYCIFAWQ